MKTKIIEWLKGDSENQMQKMPIDNLLNILNDAKANGAKYVSLDRFDISYLSQREDKMPTNINVNELANSDIIEKYKEFLKNTGKSENVSYQYPLKINKVCKEEECSWEQLVLNIDKILPQYRTGGCKEALGNNSSGAVKAALEQIKKFKDSLNS